MLGLAGLAFAACGNEDELGKNGIEGGADVTVKLNLPSNVVTSRMVAEDGHTTNKVVTVTKGVVTLSANGGTETKEFSGNDRTVTFEGIENPSSISVVINGAVPTKLADLQKKTVAGTSMIGSTAITDANKNSNGDYEVTINMEHTMARLEFSGLYHIDEDNTCKFTSADLAGVFLNNAKKGTDDGEGGYFQYEGEALSTDFWSTCPVADQIESAVNFLAIKDKNNSLPTDGKCYAYNIYPEEVTANLPVLSLYFTNVVPKDGNAWSNINKYGFARVKTYKLPAVTENDPITSTVRKALTGSEGGIVITNFPAGYIYQVKELKVADENIHTTIDGEGVDLVATIMVLDWEIVEGEVEWK